MAIVEDEVRNESEEENEIEVVVEDDDGEQDSGDDDSEVTFQFFTFLRFLTVYLHTSNNLTNHYLAIMLSSSKYP